MQLDRREVESELEEANSQCILFRRRTVEELAGHDVHEEPGLSFAWADITIRTRNAIFLSEPVRDIVDFAARVQRVRQYMESRTQPGLFWICREWLPPKVRPPDFGLYPVVTATAMAADELAPASRGLPPADYRRVNTELGCFHIADINSVTWGFPIEVGRRTLASPALLRPGALGCVAYLHRMPIACSAAYLQNERLYVALVATIPEMQGRGYGEAVTRLCVAAAAKESGHSRSVLHATPAGLPMYLRLGYRATATFTAFAPEERRGGLKLETP